VEQKKHWVQDCSMIFFLRESTQSQSVRDSTKANGMQCAGGRRYCCDMGEGGPFRPSTILYLIGGIGRFHL
jgi:hypothetical protein